MHIIDIITLLKPQKWYKNLMIFVPLIFAGKLLESNLWLTLILGFIVLCLVSSIIYIINDIVDRKADRSHPKKRNRPLASGRVKPNEAIVLAIVLAVIATVIALGYIQNTTFELWVFALFVSSMLYSFYFKNIMLVDIHLIAVNFVIRTISGTALIGVGISPWLFVIIFLLALFWASAKRKGEIATLHNARDHRRVHQYYSETMLTNLCSILAAMLLAAYTVFSSITHDGDLLVTVPFATFMIFKFLYYIYKNKEEAQSPELLIKDPQMVIALIVWLLLTFFILY
jgi:4-hydroxybenzoate polyprenyltransferase